MDRRKDSAMRFTVQITETLQRSVEIEAESAEAAETFVRRKYRTGKIVLDSVDHVGTDVEVLKR